MGPGRGRRAIERRVVDMSPPLPREEPTYVVDRSLCQVETFYVDLLREGRVFVSHWFDGQRQLADFVMVQQVKVGSVDDHDAWADVVRVEGTVTFLDVFLKPSKRQRGQRVAHAKRRDGRPKLCGFSETARTSPQARNQTLSGLTAFQ